VNDHVDVGEQGSETWLTAVLRGPDGMPSAVWERLEATLKAESDARASGEGAASMSSVNMATVNMATVTELAPRRRRSLLTGLVAAALVLVAVGIVVPVTRGSDAGPDSIVAAEASDSFAIENTTSGLAPASDPGSPSRQVVASGIDYSDESMPSDIQQVVDSIGASSARLIADVTPDTSMTEGRDGFTSSLPTLRSCLAWLTGSDRVQALFVDRATYKGSPAAVVVVPVSAGVSMLESLEVWVVSLDCTQKGSSILGHDMVSLSSN
jgi:hypothetical protein